jgi:hypothetical protein
LAAEIESREPVYLIVIMPVKGRGVPNGTALEPLFSS